MPTIDEYIPPESVLRFLEIRHQLVAEIVGFYASSPDFADPQISEESVDRFCVASASLIAHVERLYDTPASKLSRLRRRSRTTRRNQATPRPMMLTRSQAQRLLREAQRDMESLRTAGCASESSEYGRMVAGRTAVFIAAHHLSGMRQNEPDDECYVCARSLVGPDSSICEIEQALTTLPHMHAGVAHALLDPVLSYLQDSVRRGMGTLGGAVRSLLDKHVPNHIVIAARARWDCPGYLSTTW